MAETQLNFAHLHVHSHYSLLDGLASPLQLASRAKELRQPAIALTDHGSMYGVVDFYKSCKEVGIKPIIGIEAYVAPQSRLDKKAKKGEITANHLTLLAKNQEGYANLMQLSTIGFLEGFYYKPRIDIEVLAKHSKGLICLSGCQSSHLSRLIIQQKLDLAEVWVHILQELFKDNLYLEIQDTGPTPEQDIIRQALPDIAARLNLPIVATNDVHYILQEDSEAHEALLCISTGTNIYDEKRFRFPSTTYFLRSAEEMWALWPKEYLDTSIEIVNRCNLEIELNRKFHIYDAQSSFNTLKEICDERITNFPKEYVDRYQYELSAIEKTGYAEYIIVVSDFINFARRNNIPVGSGRGSSAGSLICYILGITSIDPIVHGLIFERFINVNRVEPPDIDVDICQDRRKEVLEYLKKKYGNDKVAQIAAFGTLKTKAVIKDTCRVLQLSFETGDNICKMVPEPWEGTFDDVIKISSIRNTIPTDKLEQFCNIARRIEGKPRHSSTHAAGIVISDRPLIEVTPLFVRTGSEEILTQYNMDSIADLGLLKFDILGLRTLTVISDTCKFANIKLSDIPLDDEYTYKQLCTGKTIGVFQYEGWGYTKFLKRMEPRCFNDLVALGALYRPGTLASGTADEYIKRKHGEQYDPFWPDITKDTYGILLYQEQIMQLACEFAGFSMNEADILRKAIGKKDKVLMDKVLDQFKEQAMLTHSEDEANYIIDRIITFARYGWNKAHAVSYAMLSYHTAYLKFNHPTEYFCAILNSEIHDNKRVVILANEAKICGITIEAPHINISDGKFSIHNDIIYAGLMSIKGIGENSCEAILSERKNGDYTGHINLRERVAPKSANVRVINALIEANTFREINDISILNINMSNRTAFDMFQLKELCKQHPGNIKIMIEIEDTLIDTDVMVNASPKLINRIKDLGGVPTRGI